jgi:hypothetical protein
MISLINSNNLSFVGRIILIIVAVFFILYNVAEINKYESILLSVIVAVSIIIIENIFHINNRATDPLNCEQCKITNLDYTADHDYINSNLVPNPLSDESAPEYNTEPFASNLSKLVSNLTKNLTGESEEDADNKKNQKNIINEIKELKKIKTATAANNDIRLECVRMSTKVDELDNLSNDELKTLLKIKLEQESGGGKKLTQMQEKNNEIESLTRQLDKSKIKSILGNSKKSDPYNNGDEDIESFGNIFTDESDNSDDSNGSNGSDDSDDSDDSKNSAELLNKYISEQNNKNKKLINKTEKNELPVDVKKKINKIKKKNKKSKKNKSENKSKKNKSKKSSQSEESSASESTGITYDVNSVEYQQDGLQKEANLISEKQNLFKMGIGNPDIVKPYIKDGQNYYDTIFSVSTDAPTALEAQNNELKYGYYNYVGPLNKGMINKDYTFVNPENWYPIPPHPPVCVTNKKCTTCPIQMNDGNDYMSFASLEDFDQARRFTGNMNINIDYVKDVLNKSEA